MLSIAPEHGGKPRAKKKREKGGLDSWGGFRQIVCRAGDSTVSHYYIDWATVIGESQKEGD